MIGIFEFYLAVSMIRLGPRGNNLAVNNSNKHREVKVMKMTICRSPI